jgi:A/G-specific adenine glycosylase
LLLVRADGAVLLEDRPPEGLWGGLASLPMFESEADALLWGQERVGLIEAQDVLPAYKHAFTHFDLTLHPMILRVDTACDVDGHRWFDLALPQRIGLSKPAVDLMRAVAVR